MYCDITLCTHTCVGQDSVVGVATRYGLDSLGIEYQWGARFFAAIQPVLGPSQPPVQ